MGFPRPALVAAAAQILALAVPLGAARVGDLEGVVPNLIRVEFRGGSEDDHRFAEMALGLRPGVPVDEDRLALGLTAVRMTDRFLDVRGHLEETPGGRVARIELVPLPGLKGWTLVGGLPIPVKRNLFLGLRQGMRVGDLRLEQFRQLAEARLRESGYPQAQVRAQREGDAARLRFEIQAGVPDLIKGLRFEGDAGRYGSKRLLQFLKVEPGRTLWTPEFRREALGRVRQRFMRDKRFQGQADLAFREGGNLVLKTDPGPVVRLASEGNGLGFSILGYKSLKDLVPLARAERYSPELLEAGARSIVRYLRSEGYLDAEVSYRTEVLAGPKDRPEEIRITYVLAPGERLAVLGVRFERNQEIPSAELERAAELPKARMGLFPARWTTERIGAVEERIKRLYWSRGYADISLRKLPLARKDGKGTLVFQVREGNRRLLEALVLEVPADPSFKAWYLAESLAFVFADQPQRTPPDSEKVRRFSSDRPAMTGLHGTLEEVESKGKPALRTFRFRFDRPQPLLRSDLSQVLNVLQVRVASLGVLKPATPGLRLEPGPKGATPPSRCLSSP